jgi:hypothetical protein
MTSPIEGSVFQTQSPVKPEYPPHALQYFEWVRNNWNRACMRDPSSREVIFLADGYDAATGFSLFQDLLPWLVVRHGGGEQFAPMGLLHALASGAVLGEEGFEYPEGNEQLSDGDVAKRVIDLIIEFLSGLYGEPKRQLFRDYEAFDTQRWLEIEAEIDEDG